MYCTQCGKEIGKLAKVCPYCNAPTLITRNTSEEVTDFIEEEQQKETQAEQEKQRAIRERIREEKERRNKQYTEEFLANTEKKIFNGSDWAALISAGLAFVSLVNAFVSGGDESYKVTYELSLIELPIGWLLATLIVVYVIAHIVKRHYLSLLTAIISCVLFIGLVAFSGYLFAFAGNVNVTYVFYSDINDAIRLLGIFSSAGMIISSMLQIHFLQK